MGATTTLRIQNTEDTADFHTYHLLCIFLEIGTKTCKFLASNTTINMQTYHWHNLSNTAYIMQIIFQLFPKYKPLQINTAKITGGEGHITRTSRTLTVSNLQEYILRLLCLSEICNGYMCSQKSSFSLNYENS